MVSCKTYKILNRTDNSPLLHRAQNSKSTNKDDCQRQLQLMGERDILSPINWYTACAQLQIQQNPTTATQIIQAPQHQKLAAAHTLISTCYIHIIRFFSETRTHSKGPWYEGTNLNTFRKPELPLLNKRNIGKYHKKATKTLATK